MSAKTLWSVRCHVSHLLRGASGNRKWSSLLVCATLAMVAETASVRPGQSGYRGLRVTPVRLITPHASKAGQCLIVGKSSFLAVVMPLALKLWLPKYIRKAFVKMAVAVNRDAPMGHAAPPVTKWHAVASSAK